MSSITRTVWAREAMAGLFSPAVYTGLVAYFTLSAGLFFTALQIGEGTLWSLSALWTLSAAFPLPLLVMLLTMSLFAGERAAGTLDLLLILPIPMRKVIVGKFLAVCGTVLLGVLGALVPWIFLAHNLAGRLPPLAALLPAIAMLVLHAVSWTALGLLTSTLMRRPWAAGVATLLFGGGALLAWAALSRLMGGGQSPQTISFPLVLELLDAAAGRIALRSVVLHLSFVAWCLFMCLHLLEARR
jgi:ABC-2 type transport system permease protein